MVPGEDDPDISKVFSLSEYIETVGGQLIWKKPNDDDLSHVYIPVPLTSVHLDVRVVNFTAQVEVTQEFVNKEAKPIECVYFPLWKNELQ